MLDKHGCKPLSFSLRSRSRRNGLTSPQAPAGDAGDHQRTGIPPALLTVVFALLIAAASASAAPPTASTEAATAVAYEEATLKGTVNPEGSPTTYWFEYGETEAYGSKVPISPESVGSGTAKVPVSWLVAGLKESTKYHFRVVAEGEAEIAKGKDASFTTAGFNFSFPLDGSESGELSKPIGITVDSKGNIWIADTGNNRIVEFDEKDKYLFNFGKKGTGTNAEFESPKGIVIDSADHIWVVDSGNNRVQEFNTEGTRIGGFGKEGTGNSAEFKSPTGISVSTSSSPSVLIADTGNNRIQKFNSTGSYLATFGKQGTGDGELVSPEGVLRDAAGRIWVADTGNNRVQKFSGSNFKYLSKFGEEGTGDGKFSSPIGIIEDFQEKLWVVDSGNNRAQKFDIEGNYLDKVGEEGSGSGQLIEPTGITASAPQRLQIADAGNSQIDTWAVKAEPPKATTNSASNIGPTLATLHANLNPRALATTYWFEYGLTEAYGTKIPLTSESIGSGLESVLVEQKLTGLKEGTKYYFRVVAESTAGQSFGLNRTFKTGKQPKATTDPATGIKATKATLKGLINPEGSETHYWFEYGKTEAYGTKIPLSPVLAGSGTSYVEVSQTLTELKEAITYHFQVVAEAEPGYPIPGGDKSFTTLKLPDAITEEATKIKGTSATLNGKVNPLGSATSYWFEYGETTSYGIKIPVSPESVGSGTEFVPVSQTPTGLKEGTTYHFRVVAESEAGVSSGTDKTLMTAPLFSFAFGSGGSGKGQLLHPAESAVDAEGNLWVADRDNNRIEEFDSEGNYLFQFGEKGSEKGQLFQPKSLVIDAEGDIWVADALNYRIEEFDSEGNYLFQFGEKGSKPGQFSGQGAESIAIDAEGNLWVADTYNGRLQEFDQEGHLIQIVGSYGSEPGQLGEPTGIDIGPAGNVWVADWQNKRVSEFDEAGKFIRQFGKAGSGNGEFINPDSIEVDEAGNVWVLDEGNKRIQHFDEEGNYLGKFGSAGSGEGQFKFSWPAGITSDAEGNLWIADPDNNRVQKWIPMP